MLRKVSFSAVNEGYRLNDSVTESWAASVVHQLLGALKHCHGAGVVHANIKRKNVMFLTRMCPGVSCFCIAQQAYITDFGSREILSACGRMPQLLDMETRRIKGPDAWEERGRPGPKEDLCSLG